MTTKIADKKVTRKLDYYAGQWVALLDRSVVAHHSTLKGLMKEIDARGLRRKVSVFLVPRKDEGPYVLSD